MSSARTLNTAQINLLRTAAHGHARYDKAHDLRVYVGYDENGYEAELATVDMTLWLSYDERGRKALDKRVWDDILSRLMPRERDRWIDEASDVISER